MDRGFGVPLEELSISREALTKDPQGRDRYLVVGTRVAVLAEYENVFSALGWRAGLIRPRHLGEAQWLTGNGFGGDTLLVSSSGAGFTAMVFRDKQPISCAVSFVRTRTEDGFTAYYFLPHRRAGTG